MKERGKQTDAVIFIAAIASIFALLFFTISPDPDFQKIMNWNLLAFGTIGSLAAMFALRGKSALWFPAFSGRDILDSFTTGTFWGIITVLIVSSAVFAQKTLVSLFSSINLVQLGTVTSASNILIVVLLQPITETLLLLVGILVLDEALHKSNFPMRGLIAVLTMAIIFSLFHFAVQSQSYALSGQAFPYSSDLTGYSHFVVGLGLPQFLMGLLWGGLLLIYKDYLTIMIAHVVNNLVAVVSSGVAVGDGLVVVQVISLMLIVLFVASLYLYQFEPLMKFKLRNVFGD